jgi:hypothetical protein
MIPASCPINIERMLEEHLAEECERERRAIAALRAEIEERCARLNTLESVGRAAGIETRYGIVDERHRIAQVA